MKPQIGIQMLNDITYFFRRKYQQICRVIDFLPIIWKGFDFDSHYAEQLFFHQLKRQADFMESEKAHTMCAKVNSSKIKTAVRLWKKVDDEEYGLEYQDKMKEMYGDDVMDWVWTRCEDNDELFALTYKYETWSNADEIKKKSDVHFKKSMEKQKKAHKLLWSFIEHNIGSWWD